jgi:hypothetical protein
MGDILPAEAELLAFQNKGYHIARGLIQLRALQSAEEAIFQLYRMQARKIAEHREKVFEAELEDEIPRREKLEFILDLMEQKDKEALYQVQKLFPQSWAVRELFGPEVHHKASSLIFSEPGADWDVDLTLLEGPGLFVNRPSEQRLLYKWHSEAHYYPKRRRFVNVWLPIFGKRDRHNGAMSVLPKSHHMIWDFAEYQGYNIDTLGKKNHFVQYEVPQDELTDYLPAEYTVDLDPGDVIFFDRNLVHRSNLNLSSNYGFAVVARIWCPAEDLTLAGNMAVTPYGGDPGGRPGLFGKGDA